MSLWEWLKGLFGRGKEQGAPPSTGEPLEVRTPPPSADEPVPPLPRAVPPPEVLPAAVTEGLAPKDVVSRGVEEPPAPKPEGISERRIEVAEPKPETGMRAPGGVAPGKIAKGRPAKRYLTMGIDFGTSCTKVVIQDNATKRAYAVPVIGEKGPNPYLWPTRLAIGADGKIRHVGFTGEGIDDLKVALMQRPFDSPNGSGGARAIDLASGYLAAVIWAARSWFVAKHAKVYGDGTVLWEANVGIPAAGYDDATIKEAFTTALVAGWALADEAAAESKLPGLARVQQVVDASLNPEFKLQARESLNVVPEVAAEVVGYARSSRRRIGPHVLVDVGATTLDISTFLITNDRDGFKYAFLATTVRSDLGAFRLHHARGQSLAAIGLNGTRSVNPFIKVPESWRDYVNPATLTKKQTADLDEGERKFQDNCVNSVATNVAKARRKAPKDISRLNDRRALSAVVNAERIYVFVCGGGSQIGLYRRAVLEGGRLVQSGGGRGLDVKRFEDLGTLEMPSNFNAEGLPANEFHRLAVAYGLSVPVDNIGRFIPPSELDDPPTPYTADYEKNYVSQDMV